MPHGHRAPARQRPPPLVALALVLLSGCLDPIPSGTLTPGNGVVQGYVRRWCGDQPAVAGAQVSLDGVVRAHTDESGFYRIDGVSARQHTMAADVAGYVHTETLVTLSAGEVRDQNFGLQAPGDGSTPVLDVLFVIDNSAGMKPWQDALVAAFPALAELLEANSINMNIGFVSTDVGAGEYQSPGCVAPVDNGVLQLQPRGDAGACARAPMLAEGWGDRFLSVAPEGNNFEGTLSDAFACYAPLGTDGCEFPMPLEAMSLVISPTATQNPGFLRNGALLVIIVTNRDDCSVPAKSDLFDPYQTDPASVLGPLSTYRCFEFGVTCGGETPGRAAGPRSDCQPGVPDPAHALVPVESYAAILNASHQGRVVVGVMAGPAAQVNVVVDNDRYPHLVPYCFVGGAGADPAIRLTALASSLVSTNTVCKNENDAWSQSLRSWAEQALSQAVAGRECAP